MFHLRLLFAWILMAAVPLQGFAAVSMLLCHQSAPAVHGQAASTMAASTPATHAIAGHDHSKHTHAATSHDKVSPNDGVRGTSDGAHKCSVCAACCNGVAIVGLAQVFVLAPTPQPLAAGPLVRFQARAAPVPDKPPRA